MIIVQCGQTVLCYESIVMLCHKSSARGCVEVLLTQCQVGQVGVLCMAWDSSSDGSSLSDLVDAALLTRSEDEVSEEERAPTTAWAPPATPRDLKEDLHRILCVEQDLKVPSRMSQCTPAELLPFALRRDHPELNFTLLLLGCCQRCSADSWSLM